jgi:hypothetical protein
MRRTVRANLNLILAASFTVLTFGALSLALVWRSADQAALERGRIANCRSIEEHKAFHREESAFDLDEIRAILTDLEIDPDSERGQRLIDQARRNALRDQARFAAAKC